MVARIKRDDEVMVIRGKDKGKRGKVLRFDVQNNRVVVEGVNVAKRHLKAGARGARQAGIVDQEMAMDASKVMPISPETGKPTRVKVHALEDGSKVRVAKKCGSMLN